MKVIHVTIQTNKFEEEVSFYKNFAKLIVTKEMNNPGHHIVFLAEKEGDTEIEIIDNPSADNSGNQNLSIGFNADDIDALYQKFTDAGFKPTPMVSPAPGVRFFFVMDPAGVNVQFM